MTTKDHPAPQPSGVEKDVLKPCPFCGDRAIKHDEFPGFAYGCDNPDCAGYAAAELPRQWNRRATKERT